MKPESPAIQIYGLFKDFVPPLSLSRLLTFRWSRERILALQDVNLTVPQGSIHALVGPNGAGKTTLLKCICSLLQPNKGKVMVLGADAAQKAVWVRQRVGYCITDQRSFYWRLSGRENLRFFATLQGLTGQVRPRRIEQLIAQLELESVADRRVMTYSDGMKQRLALARALLHQPVILLLDEIGRGLDPRLRERVYRMLREDLVQDKNMTIVMASHNMDEVEAMADKVHVFAGGRIVNSGTYNEMKGLLHEVFAHDAV